MHRRSLLLTLGAAVARPSFALYDPMPAPGLAAVIGSWTGTLVYADYQKPDRRVTLRTKMVATLAAPDELALYYVFDDGPGKTVYSYERMAFDGATRQLVWISGTAKPSRSQYRVTSSEANEAGTKIQFERAVEGGVDKYTLDVKPRTWLLSKVEVRSGKDDLERSRYEFTRTES